MGEAVPRCECLDLINLPYCHEKVVYHNDIFEKKFVSSSFWKENRITSYFYISAATENHFVTVICAYPLIWFPKIWINYGCIFSVLNTNIVSLQTREQIPKYQRFMCKSERHTYMYIYIYIVYAANVYFKLANQWNNRNTAANGCYLGNDIASNTCIVDNVFEHLNTSGYILVQAFTARNFYASFFAYINGSFISIHSHML